MQFFPFQIEGYNSRASALALGSNSFSEVWGNLKST